MGFLHPELLLFALPALVLWWRARTRIILRGLRLVALALVVLALSGLYLATTEPGQDVVIVIDRSRSMTAESVRSALELVALAEDARGPGDRVGVVGLGAGANIERLPSEQGSFDGAERDIDQDGTDLAAGIEAALNLIPEGRPGKLLVISDGEQNSGDAVSAARRAFARGVRIDVRSTVRPPISDLVVDEIELPQEVAVGEPFQFVAWVRADRRTEADFHLTRGGVEIASGRRVFESGINRLVFRDVLTAGGVAEYQVRLAGELDRTPENDVGLGAVRAVGPASVLVLNEDGSEDTLVRTLRAAGLPVAVTTPEGAPLDRVSLTRWRAVILENVAASRLGSGLQRLKTFVHERGGGLLVTGGQASFGVGGYHKSPIDESLPVSMELRQEHRKLSIALAIVMDRSGSMAAPAGGVTKMDLANLGAVAAIELLSPMDSVGVIAVDTAPHVVQELTSVSGIDALTARVRSIRSSGGGIFVYNALYAAAEMLDAAPQQNRHVTLFSDASDSEQPERVPELLDQMRNMGISVSVIALGTPADVDAEFLKRIAEQGQGDVYFTESPEELPRLFAQDTVKIARSTFVEELTEVALQPGLFGLGQIDTEGFPAIGGYNLTYLRPGAVAGAATTDEYTAPLVAYAYRGLGRTAVYTGQIGGAHGASVVAWEGFSSFFTTLVRWLVGQEPPTDYFPNVVRNGRSAIVSVELSPDAPAPDASGLTARIEAPDGSVRELTLERAGPNLYSARYDIESEGIALGTVRLGDDRFVTLPPISMPYSPEFEPTADTRRGERLLRRVARESGGVFGASATSLFDEPESGRGWRTISRELILAALLLLLLEIAVRRLELFATLRSPARLGRMAKQLLHTRTARVPKPASTTRPPVVPTAPSAPPIATGPTDEANDAQPTPETPASAPSAPGSSMASALSRAKRAAKRQTKR